MIANFWKSKSLILVLIMWSLWPGCSAEEHRLPLTDEQLVDVLVDIQIAEAMIDKLPSTARDTVGEAYYEVVFKTHGVSRKDFDDSMVILREDPVHLNDIYVEVLERLTVLETTERGETQMQ